MKGQIQIKISITEETNRKLKEKAQSLGTPITQYVKHLILDALENKGDTVEGIMLGSRETIEDDIRDLNKLMDAVRRVKLRASAQRYVKERRRMRF